MVGGVPPCAFLLPDMTAVSSLHINDRDHTDLNLTAAAMLPMPMTSLMLKLSDHAPNRYACRQPLSANYEASASEWDGAAVKASCVILTWTACI